jgi:hypothetical protein
MWLNVYVYILIADAFAKANAAFSVVNYFFYSRVRRGLCTGAQRGPFEI